MVYQGCKPLDQIPMVTLGIYGKPSWIIFEEMEPTHDKKILCGSTKPFWMYWNRQAADDSFGNVGREYQHVPGFLVFHLLICPH